MNNIIEYITSLNWADNWLVYAIAAFLIVVLAILVIKFIINKIKQFWLLFVMAIIAAILSYLIHLTGAIEFDIIDLIGFPDVSVAIEDGVKAIVDWFADVFALS